jgi:hypothetical protein
MSIPYHADRLQLNSRQLKEFLITIGLRALRDGDMARVQLITMLIRAGGLPHE